MLQTVYATWASIQGYGTSAFDVLKNLHDNENEKFYEKPSLETLKFESTIKFKNVSFNYNGNKNEIIKKINLTINKGDKVAVVGTTGSGKSTIIDLICGLLTPLSGKIYIDEQQLTPNIIKKWQQNIALVPQVIFLSDDTVIENICFGLNKKNIDFDRFKRAILNSNLTSFIDNLPNGHNTLVGERGVKLSGQRQRIGIARPCIKIKRL